MLAKAPGDRHQTPIDLIAELAEILDELDAPLPFATSTLPWTAHPRTVPRWRQHAVWAVPVAALILLGVTADQLTKAGSAPSPFPPLQSSSEVEPAAPAASLSSMFDSALQPPSSS